MDKSFRKCALKASPRPLFYFGEKPETGITRNNFFQNQDVLKRDYQKPLKKLTLFFFRTQSLLMGKVFKN